MPRNDPFASAEEYYAAHRPGYGDAALAHLADRFDLDADATVLDLGCGAGQLAVPLAADAGTVVAMDPNATMVRRARERAAAAGRENVAPVVGSDAELPGIRGPLRLTTMGRSFHWMDQERTLDRLRAVTEAGGGVAFVTDGEWLTKGVRSWQDAVYDVAADYLDDLPDRTGPVEYEETWDDLLAARGYVDVTAETFTVEREWAVDAVVGYVFSLSFCSPATFGDAKADFEAALRERLRAVGDPPFPQTATVEVTSGRVPA